jgi:Phage tail assembly chaperone protein
MEYRIRETGAILTQGEVRKLHANTSFPAVWDQAVCDEIGIDPILESPQPTLTRFQSASRTGVVQDSLGNWIHSWTVSDWDQEAIDAATETQWNSMRSFRNQLLAECDWTQLADNPLTNVQQAEWATYRQALRDITSQEDPFNITWPTKP